MNKIIDDQKIARFNGRWLIQLIINRILNHQHIDRYFIFKYLIFYNIFIIYVLLYSIIDFQMH